MAIFQVNLGQPVPTEAKNDGGGGDNWTTGSTSCAKLQPNHHQQTNNQFFTGQMPVLSPNQQCQSSEGKIQITDSLLIQAKCPTSELLPQPRRLCFHSHLLVCFLAGLCKKILN